MGQKRIRQYSPEFKLKVILEVLREENTINEIASKYKLIPKTIHNWKKQFLENADLAFCKDHLIKDYQQKLKEQILEKEDLYKEIGKLSSKLNWAKKKIEDLNLD